MIGGGGRVITTQTPDSKTSRKKDYIYMFSTHLSTKDLVIKYKYNFRV